MTLLDFLQNTHGYLIGFGMVGLVISTIGTLVFALSPIDPDSKTAKRFALGFFVSLSSVFLGAGLPSVPETPQEIQRTRIQNAFNVCTAHHTADPAIRLKCVTAVRKEESLYLLIKP